MRGKCDLLRYQQPSTESIILEIDAIDHNSALFRDQGDAFDQVPEPEVQEQYSGDCEKNMLLVTVKIDQKKFPWIAVKSIVRIGSIEILLCIRYSVMVRIQFFAKLVGQSGGLFYKGDHLFSA